jgi:UDP-N-acetylmuramoyl-tripeptide--D-alanyl-D-alanine ligase
MKIRLEDVARAIGAFVQSDAVASGWSVDTRTLQAGDVFFALAGPNHDGHDHVGEAFQKGALAAVVERAIEAPGPLLHVANTLIALQQLAVWARDRWGGDIIAVTGSAGKTTTKDAIARMLSIRGVIGKTTGNYNNHVGVPLSLLGIPDEARTAVIEMGMNHAGEIRELARMVMPEIGVVTNVGYAHVENFESIDEVAAAKRELIEELPLTGVAVLNADDARVRAFRDVHPGQVVTYGFSKDANVRAELLPSRPGDAGLRFQVEGRQFESSVAGRHGVSNLLAGMAVARVYGIPFEKLHTPVREFEPGKMRGGRIECNGISIFDDCYNSNPDAVRAMLDVLRDTPAQRRIAVLGEMLELGRWAGPLHREVGKYVASSGISVLVGIRGVARHLVDAAIEGGLATDSALFFERPEDAGSHLKTLTRPGDAILFKGSRGTHVEKALERFLE